MFYNNSPNYCYGTYYYCYGKSDRTGLCFKIFYKYAIFFSKYNIRKCEIMLFAS